MTQPTKIDHQLVDRARNGDMTAYQRLYQQFRNPIYFFIYRMLHHKQDAEDVLQEVFVTMHQRLHMLRKNLDFEGWLFRIARNKSIDMIRKNARLPSPTEAEPDDSFAGTVEDPHEVSERRALEQRITRALSKVPEKPRAAFILAVIQGYSYKEVAEFTHCSLNNVKSQIFRARTIVARDLGNLAKWI